MADVKQEPKMTEFEKFERIVEQLRSENGCPWDRAQTHISLKPACIEEAAEVICGINHLENTGNPDNLKEELGDLLLQVVMHAQIAKEEGLFTMEDVIACVSDKMIRRHPHVFGSGTADDPQQAFANWEEVKAQEKKGKEDLTEELFRAFDEARDLIDRAEKRKREKTQ